MVIMFYVACCICVIYIDNIYLWICLHFTSTLFTLSMIIISASKLCLHYCYIYWPIPDICSLDLGRSELNRLNFQGFYTVLLERNEELISVAAVR